MAAFGSGAGKKGRRRAKDQQMAGELKRLGVERDTGRCVVCYGTIPNGVGAYNHYAAHARGAHAEKGGR